MNDFTDETVYKCMQVLLKLLFIFYVFFLHIFHTDSVVKAQWWGEEVGGWLAGWVGGCVGGGEKISW